MIFVWWFLDFPNLAKQRSLINHADLLFSDKTKGYPQYGHLALRPFLKPIPLISSLNSSNFLPSFSAYEPVFSILWSVGTPYTCERCSDTVLLIVQGHEALATQLHCTK